MTEAFLQYVWRHQLMRLDELRTVDNEQVSVIRVGMFNANAGPDFLNARIKIGDTTWAGDVEIHVKSSDWIQHRHTAQKSYNSVILHAVSVHDKEVKTEQGQRVPTIVMPILPHISENYMKLSDIKDSIKCARFLPTIDSIHISMLVERMVAERFEQKSASFMQMFEQNNHDWNETVYQLLARNFGFSTNADAFELLAKSLPLKIIEKHGDSLFQIEALLFGQADLIPHSETDAYAAALLKEYQFLQKKYGLQPISPTWWKFARMRPYSFPTVRLAQFAYMLHSAKALVSSLLEASDLATLYRHVTNGTSDYWKTHFLFGKETAAHSALLGKQAENTIVINTFIVFLFAYGKERKKEDICQRAYDFLLAIPPESNSIVAQWEHYGVKPSSAYETQGLLQIFKHYCSQGKCLRCGIGHKVMQKK